MNSVGDTGVTGERRPLGALEAEVLDLLLASGVSDAALEVNAYGKSQSIAEDSDGYALERRVRLTLQMESGAAVAQVGKNDTQADQTDCW